MPRGMWWLGHHPWFAETGIRGLESKASRHGGLFNETYSSGEGGCNVSDSIQLLPSPKDPAMGEGLLSVLRWG